MERYYEEAIYAVKNGMIVGNHSYSHPAFSSLTMKECIDEIEKCEGVLERLYRDSGVERKVKPFRFPYGDKGGDNKTALQKYFQENGFHKVDDTHIAYPWWRENNLHTDIDTFWTFDFEEYKIWQDLKFTKESVWEKCMIQIRNQGRFYLGRTTDTFFLCMHTMRRRKCYRNIISC